MAQSSGHTDRPAKSASELVEVLKQRLGDIPQHYIHIQTGPDGWYAEINGSEDVVAAYQPALDAAVKDLQQHFALRDSDGAAESGFSR